MKHQYTIEQARILLDVLKYHNGSTLRPPLYKVGEQVIDNALDKLRKELTEYIATDDGLGFIVPSRDDNGLL